MKTFSTLASTLSLVALAKAQVTVNNDGSIKCASSGNYCAGDSLSSNIIIRCSSGTGVAGNCNDNLAGINPVGVKSFAPCWQSSSTAGDAACSYNGVAYPDQGDSFVISGASSSAPGYGSKSTSKPVKPGYGASTPSAYSSTSKGGYGASSSSSKGGYGSSSSSSKAGYGSTSTPTPSSSSKAGYTNSTLTKTVTVTATSAKSNLTTTVITSNAGTSTRVVTVTSSGAPVPVSASSASGSANSNVATTVVPASSVASTSATAQPSQFTGAAAPALLGGKEMALAGLVGVMGVMLGL